MNFTKNEVRNVKPRNALLSEADFDIYDEDDITAFEDGTPSSRGLFKASYTHGRVRLALGTNYYGKQLERTSVDPDEFRTLQPKMVVDLDLSVEMRDGWSWTMGAENILDNFPTRFNTFGGIFTYRTGSGMGFNGRYLYTRMSYRP